MWRRRLFALLAVAAGAAGAAADVNRADMAALETVKGIGPALSTAIVEERSRGAFKDWADLMRRVKGIAAGNAARLSQQGLTVDGRAFQAASQQ